MKQKYKNKTVNLKLLYSREGAFTVSETEKQSFTAVAVFGYQCGTCTPTVAPTRKGQLGVELQRVLTKCQQ